VHTGKASLPPSAHEKTLTFSMKNTTQVENEHKATQTWHCWQQQHIRR
jgi:hypothetical protein